MLSVFAPVSLLSQTRHATLSCLSPLSPVSLLSLLSLYSLSCLWSLHHAERGCRMLGSSACGSLSQLPASPLRGDSPDPDPGANPAPLSMPAPRHPPPLPSR